MHEFSLYAQFPAARYEQILSVLAGIAGTQPQPFHERHLLHRPPPIASRLGPKAKVQDPFASSIQQFIQTLDETDFGNESTFGVSV